MGLSYLNGASWRSITRDERFFCSRLFALIEEKGIGNFISYINANSKCDLDPASNWEPALEACFYRDFLHYFGKSKEPYMVHRTFDLCLFSNDTIVIIEAKAHDGFATRQMTLFDQDKESVKWLTKVNRVVMLALSSSNYRPRSTTREHFDGWLYWASLASHYGHDQVLQRADKIYQK